MTTDARELVRAAQAAEIQGEKAQARELLERASRAYAEEGQAARAEQLKRHAERLSPPSPEVADRARPQPPPWSGESRGPVLASGTGDAWCSFCCRPRAEVGVLIQAPVDAFICAGCLTQGRELLPGRAAPAAEVKLAVLAPQVEAAQALEARLANGQVQALVLGNPGAGKTSWLRAFAARGLGEYLDARSLVETGRKGTGPLLVDDVDLLDPLSRVELPRRLLGPFVLAAKGTLPSTGTKLAALSFSSPVFTTEELQRATAGKVPTEVLERVSSVHRFETFSPADLLTLAQARAGLVLEPAEVQTLVDSAAQSPRGAHELMALLGRALALRSKA